MSWRGLLKAAAAIATLAAAIMVLQLGASSQTSDDAQVREGQQLFLRGCSTCHGAEGFGTDLGPPLRNVGAAAADFMLRTGRMPLANEVAQAPTKPEAYDNTEIEALVAFVATLGDGPEIPDVDPDNGDLAFGGELYRANCAACHNASGVGGALSDGTFAPPLLDVEPTQIAEAMRIGPGQMPVFGTDTFDQDDLDSIVRYVVFLQESDNPGGAGLGRAGPIPEGFVAILFGLGLLVLLIRWITRSPKARD